MTSTASSIYFATSGASSKPAGIKGLLASTGTEKAYDYGGDTLPQVMTLQQHALATCSPYVDMTPPGWTPREPAIKPSAGDTGAGMVSAGSIDNTYVPMPLANRWGKAREKSKNEIGVKPHTQASDLLIVSKGAVMPCPLEGEADMASIRPKYSRTIPLYHSIDPQRAEAGFMRAPNNIPGSLPAPASPLAGLDMPAVPPDWQLRKLAYDQSAEMSRTTPISRVVREKQPYAPADAPQFVTKAAGLPGGLSLTKS